MASLAIPQALVVCIVGWWLHSGAIRIGTLLSRAWRILATLARQLLTRAHTAGPAKMMLPDDGAEISPCLRQLAPVALVLLCKQLVAAGNRFAPYALQADVVGLLSSSHLAQLLVVES